MKTTKENLKFCNEFTFYDHYNNGPVIELNFIRYYMIIISESDFKQEDNRIRVMGIIGISLKVIDGDVKNFEREISNMRVGILQMLFLERLYTEGRIYERRPSLIRDGTEVTNHDEMNLFKIRNGFNS